ncbi:MAG TPA: phosphoglucosamine mutase [Thermoanaerobaculia bacterium]
MKLFGTDGLRGRAGVFPLDPRSLRVLGREVGESVRREGGERVALGGDTRESTPAMAAQLAAGLEESGCAVASAGVVPTPAVAELVLALRAGAGISVSASHNPYEDNGVKVFGRDGRKWPDEKEEAVEEKLLSLPPLPGEGRGEGASLPPTPDPGLAETYLDRLVSRVPRSLREIAVLVDAANGAAYRVGPEALRRAGCRVTPMADRPDGRNINAQCGAMHPDGMARATSNVGADMGVALDGDADRAIFADERGRLLDGDDVLWIVARRWKRNGRLSGGGVVGTVMSNFGLEMALAREGIPFHRAAVGDRSVAQLMQETGASLGGETSGHILFAPLSPSGDGIQTALVIASILSDAGTDLSQLATLEKTPQALRNVRVSGRESIDGSLALSRAVSRAKGRLGDRGRVFLRYSGTEPLLRILVEGSDEKEVREIADDLEAAVREAFPSPGS